MPDTKQYFTCGWLASVYQKAPQTLLALLDTKGIKPEMRINNLDHYGPDAIFALDDHFNPKPVNRSEIET